MKGLTDIPGIRVGHVSDYEALTGCTVILCEAGAVGGVDIRGSASGTEETPTLDPGHVTPQVHAILLAGGSRAARRHQMNPIANGNTTPAVYFNA